MKLHNSRSSPNGPHPRHWFFTTKFAFCHRRRSLRTVLIIGIVPALKLLLAQLFRHEKVSSTTRRRTAFLRMRFDFGIAANRTCPSWNATRSQTDSARENTRSDIPKWTKTAQYKTRPVARRTEASCGLITSLQLLLGSRITRLAATLLAS